MYELKPNEEKFEVKPIGIRYRCEFCHKGEMKCIEEKFREDGLLNHQCSKCKKIMLLPKIYPYIEWINTEETS